jgi:hypothetical protein
MKRISKRGVVFAVVGLLALASGSAILASRLAGSPPDPAALDKAVRDAPMTRVADIAAAGALPKRGAFVQVTSTGQVCLWDAASADSNGKQGGCNDAGDPLAGAKVFASLSYDGGPAAAAVKDARLIGLADPSVERVSVLMSDGTYREMALEGAKIQGRSYRAFGYRFRPSDLRRGLGPVAVLALDASGAEVDRQSTGFGD